MSLLDLFNPPKVTPAEGRSVRLLGPDPLPDTPERHQRLKRAREYYMANREKLRQKGRVRDAQRKHGER